MNRNKLKAYAPQARRDFIKAVTDRAAYYGLMKDRIEPMTIQGDVAIIGGKPFPKDVAKKRKRLEEQIRREGFEQVMEAMAYTWFNRFVAIRFMELHGYLEHGYLVLSTTDYTDSTDGKDKKPVSALVPDILKYAEHVDLPELNQNKVVELKLAGNRDEELYRMLLIAQCNALHKAMPFLFEWIGDATELLLPKNLLHSNSLIRKLVNEIPEEEWKAVEIIGWLYQFYISEKKDQVIGKVVKSEDIPAATQLFTPNWIVKYMVQNTLGRQWIATYPNSPLKKQIEYYIEPAEQTQEVQEQIKAITPESLNPEELTLLDPACGSGHILVEAYDLLKAIYQERGYRGKDIPRLILEKNLYGLEIDDRAAQLAAFALMMKARADDRRIFDNGTKPHVLAIQDSKGMDAEKITEALNAPIVKGELPTREMLFEEMDEARAPLFSRKNLSVKGEIPLDDVAQLIQLFDHGKTFGSLIRVSEKLPKKLPSIADRVKDVLAYGDIFGETAARRIMPLIEQATILEKKYDCVVTNPPYMSNGYFDTTLKKFVNRNYPSGKSDLYGCFILRNLELCKDKGFVSMITIPNWMFLWSFEKLRYELINKYVIDSLVQNGRGIWGSDFGSCSFTIRNTVVKKYRGSYKRLFDIQGSVSSVSELETRFFEDRNFVASSGNFESIPGSPIAYWASQRVVAIFDEMPTLRSEVFSEGPCKTGNDEKYLRFFWEVDLEKIGPVNDWCLCSKGGGFRKYYGNLEHVISWKPSSREHYRKDHISRITPERMWNERGITWTIVSAKKDGNFRELPKDCQYNSVSPTVFLKQYNELNYLKILVFINSLVPTYFLSYLNPTLALNVSNILSIPFEFSMVALEMERCQEVLKIARRDWNNFETSLNFQSLPELSEALKASSVVESWSKWAAHCNGQAYLMREFETENNRVIIEAYELADELSPEVPEDQITLYRPKREEDAKRLISHAIGCMMGRYSLDQPGLIYAHSGNDQFWEIYHEKHNKPAPAQNKNHSCNSWSTFPPDQDGIIPITDTDWFPDDASNRLSEFISVAWHKEHLEENLRFVAESLGAKRGESPRETIRRYVSTGFFKHHMKIYKKRPIYWLFSSGKLRAFQCLVYLHRYNEGTLSRMRTEYVIPLQGKVSARIEQLSGDINAATSTAHRKKLERERDKLIKQQTELQAFDEKLRHYADQRIILDLDDGVKVNYGKFGDLLAEVKAVTGKKKE